MRRKCKDINNALVKLRFIWDLLVENRNFLVKLINTYLNLLCDSYCVRFWGCCSEYIRY